MTLEDFLVCKLSEYGVKNAFGVPGGVVLDFMYALDLSKEIEIHLNYNEQAAGLAACGSAQITNKLSVAYATKGPGIANMFPAIAEAYFESLPVLFITSHSVWEKDSSLRSVEDQEMDIVSCVKKITKYADRIDDLETAKEKIIMALELATSGRKGATLLDIKSSLFKEELEDLVVDIDDKTKDLFRSDYVALDLNKCRKPLLLIGDGVRQSDMSDEINKLICKLQIPVVSSRAAQGIVRNKDLYFGYIGSHGVRYANIIFEAADYIISIGNRMSFPLKSQSYNQALQNKIIKRIEIDPEESKRKIPNCESINTDIRLILHSLNDIDTDNLFTDWLSSCRSLKRCLKGVDSTKTVGKLADILESINDDTIIVSDVGNNEFWLSRAYEMIDCTNRIMYSKSFGTLGSAIPKALGAFYASKDRIWCFCGDQGLQFNIQELINVGRNGMPIWIFVINNRSSGMIEDREKSRFNKLLHVNSESGYESLDLEKLSKCYNLNYINYKSNDDLSNLDVSVPAIIEIKQSDGEMLIPSLPKGNNISIMQPSLNENLSMVIEQFKCQWF